MSFEQIVKLPADRVGALVGRNGKTKTHLEEQCGVTLTVDSKTGDVIIKLSQSIEESDPFKAVSIVNSIAKGFSPERAFKLLNDENMLGVIDLKEIVGKSRDALRRIKGRIIGLNGKSRRLIEELTGVDLSVYGHTASVIGNFEETKRAMNAIDKLAKGSPHNSVYKMLQRARQKSKIEKLQLWEDGKEFV